MCDIEKTKLQLVYEHYEAMKTQYKVFLSPLFNCQKVKKMKNYIYSLNLAEWKLDKIWEYFNDDIDEELFKKLVWEEKIWIKK